MTNETTPSEKAMERKGRIAFVGTGLKAIAHMTPESIAEIKSADRVFYHAADGVTASYIRSLNKKCHDLYQYCGIDKKRNETYLQMAEVMLAAVRKGESVCGVYYGHPGVFVKAIRRVRYQCRQEGHEVLIYPGITTMDYIFAELDVDPSRNGCQILDATDYYIRKRKLNTASQVIMLQIGAFADNKFDFKGYARKNFSLLVQALLDEYEGDNSCTLFRGSNFPGIPSSKVSLKLSDLLNEDIQRKYVTGVTTLYIPPKTLLGAVKERVEASGYGKAGSKVAMGPTAWETANTEKTRRVAENLPHHQLPEGYIQRRASPSLLKLMHDLATDTDVLKNLQNAPGKLVQSYSLSKEEQRAVLSGSTSRVSHVSLADTATQATANAFLNSLLENGTTAKLYQTYYNTLAGGGTADQADAAVQTFINNLGYSGVTTSQVDNAITTVAGGNYSEVTSPGAGSDSNATYPPFGTSPSILYGTYQTFDSQSQPSILIKLYNNNSTYRLQVATSATGQLVDITASTAFNGNTGEFLVTSSDAFPYNGNLKFASCVVSNNGTQTTDFNVAVSLTPSGQGSPITSSGRRSVYSAAAALQPATVDSPSLWAGDYTCKLNDSTQATLTISSDGSTITFQGTTVTATFNPFYSYFQCTIGNQTLVINMQWTYFTIYAGNTFTGPNFFGYYYATGSTKPTSPNLYGNLGTTPPPPPSPSQKNDETWTQIGIAIGIGVGSMVIFECIKLAVKAGYNLASKVIENLRSQGDNLANNANTLPIRKGSQNTRRHPLRARGS